MSNPKPQYKKLTFNSKVEFDKWLSEKAIKKINFEHNGQDLTFVYIDKHGEILHCGPFQASIWNGCFVSTVELEEFTPVTMYLNSVNEWRRMNFIVESIEDLN